jgi:hypothetical protein
MQQGEQKLGDTNYHYVKCNVLNSLQHKEIGDLKDRIKRLEEALDTLTLVVGLTPIRGNLAALQEAMDQSRSVLKAKEAKL